MRELHWMAAKRMEVAGAEIGWMLSRVASMNPFAKQNVKFTANQFNPYREPPKPIKTSDPSVLINAFCKRRRK